MDLYHIKIKYIRYVRYILLEYVGLNNEFVFVYPEPPIINILDQEFVANLDYVLLCFLL